MNLFSCLNIYVEDKRKAIGLAKRLASLSTFLHLPTVKRPKHARRYHDIVTTKLVLQSVIVPARCCRSSPWPPSSEKLHCWALLYGERYLLSLAEESLDHPGVKVLLFCLCNKRQCRGLHLNKAAHWTELSVRLAFRIAVNAFLLTRLLKVPPPREKSMWGEYNADSSDTAKGHCIRKPYLCCVTFGCAGELCWIPVDTQSAPVGGNRTDSHTRDWWCKPANDTSLFSLFILFNARRGRLRRQLLQTAQLSQFRMAGCQCCDSKHGGECFSNIKYLLSARNATVPHINTRTNTHSYYY